MAYGLRYTITQRLRNGNDQVIEIWEKDYIAGVVKTYKPVSIIVQPNSSEEYPYPTIISTQLNFSILLETQDDYDQFPNVLSQDDRKYLAILKESTNVMWRGFMFNDYTQMGFSTGITQADFTCIDGISFIKNIEYIRDDSINQLTTQLNVISAGLNLINYPSDLNLVVACSYFADGMNDRQDAVSNEPFSQIYQYRRDFMGESYYDIISKIMTSFNCRMFQANGDWWICSMNEMAAPTNYYTKYSLPSLTITSSGVLNNTVNIVPYSNGNVHFINNSQVKILKKGFYNIQGRGAYESAINYCDNANLKLNDGTNVTGFIQATSGTGNVDVITHSDSQFDELFLARGSSGDASISNGNTLIPYFYLPYIGEVPFSLSFEHNTFLSAKLQIKLITAGGTRYLDTNGVWQTSVQNIAIPDTAGSYDTFSKDIPPYIVSSVPIFGYLQFTILVNVSGENGYYKNFIIKRGTSQVSYIQANYNPYNETQSTLKVFEQPYGNNYPTISTAGYSINKGVLCSSDGKFLKSWYSSTTMGTPYGAIDLVVFMTYQNIRNLNKNVATVECDLGEHTTDVGFVYLDKVFTTTDTISGNLSYSGKKFILNRVSQNAYMNEMNSVQLIEVSVAQIEAFIIPTYITDAGQLGPFWLAQFNINIV